MHPTPYRILLVADAPAVCEALRWAFENESDLLVVGEASDGIEAITHAAALAPDIVILDIELPGRDGYVVARALKSAPRPPVVIFLTVHGDHASRLRGIAAGGDGFVKKAVGWAALIASIRSLTVSARERGGNGVNQGGVT